MAFRPLVLAVLLAGCAAPPLPSAPGPAATDVRLVSTEVAVDRQGGAFWRVSEETLRPHLAPGYEPAECAPGFGPTALIYLSQREYPDLTDVPGTVRQLFLVTCATPPPGYERPDPVGEPDRYVLYEAADSDAWIAFARAFGDDVARAGIEMEPLGDVGFSFEARLGDGSLLAKGTLGSPGVPLPAPGTPFACEPVRSVGRMLAPNPNGTYVSDWSKTESTCAGAGTVAHPPDGVLASFVGPAPSAPVVAVVEVHEAVHSFFRMP